MCVCCIAPAHSIVCLQLRLLPLEAPLASVIHQPPPSDTPQPTTTSITLTANHNSHRNAICLLSLRASLTLAAHQRRCSQSRTHQRGPAGPAVVPTQHPASKTAAERPQKQLAKVKIGERLRPFACTVCDTAAACECSALQKQALTRPQGACACTTRYNHPVPTAHHHR